MVELLGDGSINLFYSDNTSQIDKTKIIANGGENGGKGTTTIGTFNANGDFISD